MRQVLLDADVFRFLHALDFLSIVHALSAKTRVGMTEYVARHELSLLARQLGPLETSGDLVVHRLVKGTPEQAKYREYLRGLRDHAFTRPVDKGECEAIAWAVTRAPEDRPVFVSCDAGARWLAAREGVPSTDLLGLTVAAVRFEALSREALATRLSPWESPGQEIGRPAEYVSFDDAFAKVWTGEADLFG